MHDLSPGQEVTVSPNGLAATVLYVRDMSVRVRINVSGAERTVAIKRVTPKRESKSLTVGPAPLDSIADIVAPIQRVYDQSLRPVPKPVTLTSPAYLAYVRKHLCCLCGATPSEAHHWSHHGGVMGAKVDDYRTVPLCTKHHRYWHDHGTLPGRDLRQDCEWFFVREQRHLIQDWIDGNGTAVADGDMVDALIRAIGGADA